MEGFRSCSCWQNRCCGWCWSCSVESQVRDITTHAHNVNRMFSLVVTYWAESDDSDISLHVSVYLTNVAVWYISEQHCFMAVLDFCTIFCMILLLLLLCWFIFRFLTNFLSRIVLFLLLTLPCLCPCSEALDSLKSVIDKSKGLKASAVRPLVLAAEENLHNMVVDLDKVVTKVRTWFSTLLISPQNADKLSGETDDQTDDIY